MYDAQVDFFCQTNGNSQEQCRKGSVNRVTVVFGEHFSHLELEKM